MTKNEMKACKKNPERSHESHSMGRLQY